MVFVKELNFSLQPNRVSPKSSKTHNKGIRIWGLQDTINSRTKTINSHKLGRKKESDISYLQLQERVMRDREKAIGGS